MSSTPHALIAALVLGLPAAAAGAGDAAALTLPGQYSAEMDRHGGAWRLLPLSGGEMEVRLLAGCPSTAVVPEGLWLVSRDAEGEPVLLAPSATVLPDGHPGRIRLASCGTGSDATGPTLDVPEPLSDWLARHGGVVRVK